MSFARSTRSSLLHRRMMRIGLLFCCCLCLMGWVWELAPTQAQDPDPFFYASDEHALRRGSGGYFAWYKLVIITVIFAIWVAVTDYANREALRLADFMKSKPEVWNPVFVVSFLVGFIAIMTIPWFWAGLPIYLLACFLPLILFLSTRNREVDKSMRKAVSETGKVGGPIQIVQQNQLDLNPIEIVATAQPGQTDSQTLFNARQTPGFAPMKDMVARSLENRADVIALSCTREKAVAQMQVDGMWHPMMEFDPPTAQGLVTTSQLVAGCAPGVMDRPQDGGFRVARERSKWAIRFSSQPTKSDFRCVFRFESNDDHVMNLSELGLTEQQANLVRENMAGDGVFVAAATPGQGMTALWRTCLQSTDRWTRDWFAIVPETDSDTVMENVARETFPPGDVSAAIDLVERMALKEAGAYVVPELFDKKLVDKLLQESQTEGRKTLTRFSAKSASEALLRAYAAAGDRKAMAKALKGAIYQKLVRKLCTNCRESTKVAPELIQKLGGDPQVQDFLYTTRQIPAELPKDYMPCPVCHDIGYMGRTGIFEIIVVNDSIRKVLLTQPKIENIAAIARKTGNPSLMQAGFHLVLSGTTTIEELKRVCGNG